MTTSAKITTGLIAVVLAGLLAFGFVLMYAPVEQPAEAATASSAAPDADPEAGSTPEVEPVDATESVEPEDPADLPEGYVSVGHGTWIPAGGPGDCEASAYIWIGSDNGEPVHATMEGADLVDMGPQEFATGEVDLDEQGRPLTYTVAPGDVIDVIGDRFCIWNGLALTTLNNYPVSLVIQPGDELLLNADYATDFEYPYATE